MAIDRKPGEGVGRDLRRVLWIRVGDGEDGAVAVGDEHGQRVAGDDLGCIGVDKSGSLVVGVGLAVASWIEGEASGPRQVCDAVAVEGIAKLRNEVVEVSFYLSGAVVWNRRVDLVEIAMPRTGSGGNIKRLASNDAQVFRVDIEDSKEISAQIGDDEILMARVEAHLMWMRLLLLRIRTRLVHGEVKLLEGREKASRGQRVGGERRGIMRNCQELRAFRIGVDGCVDRACGYGQTRDVCQTA